MSEPQFSNTDLNQCRQQLEAWRRTRLAGAALPEPLWRAAAALAKVHGPGCVGRALRLNFYKLRQRLRQLNSPAKKSPPPPQPAFVEVAWTPSHLASPVSSAVWTLELSDGGDQRLRLQMSPDAAAVAALAQAFWRRNL